MEDPIPAIEKRMKRSNFVRTNEKHAAWYSYDEWTNSKELDGPVGKLFTIALGSTMAAALGTIATEAVKAGKPESFPWTIALSWFIPIFTIWSVYMVYIPLVNAFRFRIPSQLTKGQREAVETFEKMDNDDQVHARSALYDFVRQNDESSITYRERERVWDATVREITRMRQLTERIQLAAPSAGEETLEILKRQNDDMARQLELSVDSDEPQFRYDD